MMVFKILFIYHEQINPNDKNSNSQRINVIVHSLRGCRFESQISRLYIGWKENGKERDLKARTLRNKHTQRTRHNSSPSSTLSADTAGKAALPWASIREHLHWTLLFLPLSLSSFIIKSSKKLTSFFFFLFFFFTKILEFSKTLFKKMSLKSIFLSLDLAFGAISWRATNPKQIPSRLKNHFFSLLSHQILGLSLSFFYFLMGGKRKNKPNN